MSITSAQADQPRQAPVTSDVPVPARRSTGLGALLLRLHFYAGVLVAPFLVVAAMTGLAYTITPQLDAILYDTELHAEPAGRAAKPLSEQVAAARATHPDGTLSYVAVGAGDVTTQVVFTSPELGEKQHSVYVDPYTAQVKGQLTTWFGYTPVRTWLD
uniref:PepSY domain-containing protein n=1 Tax=Amycolatopsis sp. lyj-346 TaxID=2789289 RepID=UPI00397BFA36